MIFHKAISILPILSPLFLGEKNSRFLTNPIALFHLYWKFNRFGLAIEQEASRKKGGRGQWWMKKGKGLAVPYHHHWSPSIDDSYFYSIKKNNRIISQWFSPDSVQLPESLFWSRPSLLTNETNEWRQRCFSFSNNLKMKNISQIDRKTHSIFNRFRSESVKKN